MCSILHQAAFDFSAADLVPVNKNYKVTQNFFDFKTNFDKCGYWILLRQMKDWEKNKLWVHIRPMCIILHQAAFVFSAADLVPVNKIAIFVAKCWSHAGCCLMC